MEEPSTQDLPAAEDPQVAPEIKTTPSPQSAQRYTAMCGLIAGKSLEDIATECEISTSNSWKE